MGEAQPDPGAVEDVPFLAALPPDERERLLAHVRVVRFDPGQVVFEREQPARAMYVVTQGTARVDVGGRYHDLTRGALLGEMGLLSSKPRMRTVTALDGFEALEIEGFGCAAFAFVANCDPYTYAGSVAVHPTPLARFELGLDVFAPRRVRPRDVPWLLWRLVRPRERPDTRLIQAHDLDRIGVRCLEPLPLQVDGEDLGDVTEAAFLAERDAVSVLVGPEYTGPNKH